MTPPLLPLLLPRVLGHLGVRAGSPDEPLLAALLAAYVRTVPWESATRIAKRVRTADTPACPRWPEEFWSDAMERGAGGTCFESNYAFFSLLRALGYDGYLTVNDMHTTRACHTAIVITVEGRRWLVDAGMPLYAPLPLDEDAQASANPFHVYTVVREEGEHLRIERDNHPHQYCFTLIDRPIEDAAYRAVTTADYGAGGLFLDRVILTRVIDGRVWRFNSGQQPYQLEEFGRTIAGFHPITGDVAAAVAGRFAIDEGIVRTALDAVAATA